MFATFTPVHEGSGEPLHGEVVIVNLDNVTRIKTATKDAGWKCEGLILSTADGKEQWVYLAPNSAAEAVTEERMSDLGARLEHSPMSPFGESMWSPEEDRDKFNA